MESEGGTYSEQKSHKSELRRPTFYFTIPQIPNTDITRLHERFSFSFLPLISIQNEKN